MVPPESRRDFLKVGSAAAAGLIAAAPAVAAQEAEQKPATQPPSARGTEARDALLPRNAGGTDVTSRAENPPAQRSVLPQEFQVYDRYYPTYGGPEDSDQFLGKLVPGLRASGLPPVPFVQPDVPRLAWKWVDGVKEFHLHVGPTRREILPGQYFDMYGANGSMPGPFVEATQGDTVRMVVHNHLAEATTVHWHGAELPNNMDGVPGVTQDFIEPGTSYVYQFRVHQAGTFFYHVHVPFQEANGLVGFFIIHPQIAWDPVVDRDFGLLVSNVSIPANSTITTPFSGEHPGLTATLGHNWQMINGRSGPYTTPLVCKLGERVRIRLFNFSPVTIHSIHMHGTNFWLTGREGARTPKTAWISRNTEAIHVAQATDLEFIANDAGDWVVHCHMASHMLNHPVQQMGPRVRSGESISAYKANVDVRPPVTYPHTDPGFQQPGYPMMRYLPTQMTPKELEKLNARREVRGMRWNWHHAVRGMFTIVRILPDDLYQLAINSDAPVKPGEIFDEMVRRRQRQEELRNEMRRRGLNISQWNEWFQANEALRRKGLA